MTFDVFTVFLITTFLVVLSPGPAALAVASEAATNSYKRSTLVIFGIALANVVFFALSATGIAALLISSESVFNAIKWIGVVYLVYLGTGAIFSKCGAMKIAPHKNKTLEGKRWAFTRGFVLEISNPKALLYFVAILPQFVDVEMPIFPQLIIMCIATLILDLIGYSLYGLLGSKVRESSISPRAINIINNLAGGALLYAAFKMAFVGLVTS